MMSNEKLIQAQAEREADRILHQLRMQKLREPERKQAAAALLKQDQETFNSAAKVLRSFALNEANFNVIRQTLGENFSIHQIREMLAGNGAMLSPPTQQELDQWNSAAIEQHNEALQRMDPDQLRARVRQEAADSRVAQATAAAASQLEAAQKRDAVMGFPALPDTWNGQKLDAAFIKNCSVETQKLLSKRFGSAQLTARLRGAA
jgi:DNA-binding transcriptional MerR regulator